VANTVAIEDMPDVVHEPYAFLLDKTDVEPVVERSGYGRMLLTHTGERTRMTIQFRLDGRKWRWEKSRLFIDGKSVDLAKGWDMYVAIFKDPDNGRKNYTPEGAKKAVIPESAPVDEKYVPGPVATELRNLRKAVEKDGTTVVPTVVSNKNQYLITVDDGDSDRKIVFVFGFENSLWRITDLVLVNARGYDVSRYVSEQELEEILREILGATKHNSQESYLPGMHQQGPQGVSNSVQVRKSTVFRI